MDKKKKTSHDKAKFKQYLSTNPVLQTVFKGKLQPKEVSHTKETQGINNPRPKISKRESIQQQQNNKNQPYYSLTSLNIEVLSSPVERD